MVLSKLDFISDTINFMLYVLLDTVDLLLLQRTYYVGIEVIRTLIRLNRLDKHVKQISQVYMLHLTVVT